MRREHQSVGSRRDPAGTRAFVAGLVASMAFAGVALALNCSTFVQSFNPAPGYPLLPTPQSGAVVVATNSAAGFADATGTRSACDYSGTDTGQANSDNCQLDVVTVGGDPGCSAILTGTYTLTMGNIAEAMAMDCQDEQGNYYDRGEAWGHVKLTDDASHVAGPADVHLVVLGTKNPQYVPPQQNVAAPYTTLPAITPCVTSAQFWGTVDSMGKAQVTGRAFAHGRGNYSWASMVFTLQIQYC